MAKTLLFFKAILFSITVLDRLSNVDSFKTTKQGLSTLSTPSTTSETSNSSVKIVWNQTEDQNRPSEQNAHYIGQIVLKLSLFLYSCLAIAYLCDEYFVSSLEYLGKAFHLPPDITGAILIPIGTSGPEIFSSAIGVFFASNDIGTGAIIGSAVFNLLAIPAACGVAVYYFIGESVKLEPLPILRDTLFYILSIIVLILVIKDNRVDLMDSSLLTLLFGIYVGVMIYNAKLSMDSNDQILDIKTNKSENLLDRTECTPLLNDKTVILLERLVSGYKETVEYGNFGKTLMNQFNHKNGYEEIINKKLKEIEEDVAESGLMNNCFFSLILTPVHILFYMTLPKSWPVITFLVSIGWLTGLSYGTVWAISGLSETLSIPQTISGMTILAAGSADLVTSIIVIRKHGLASMGMCAAIASNIFAIVLGLGLPWFLKCLILLVNNNGNYGQTFIPIESDALPYTSIVLLIIIFAFLLALKLCSWKLFLKFSLVCVLIHVIFLGASVSLELFVHS